MLKFNNYFSNYRLAIFANFVGMVRLTLTFSAWLRLTPCLMEPRLHPILKS